MIKKIKKTWRLAKKKKEYWCALWVVGAAPFPPGMFYFFITSL